MSTELDTIDGRAEVDVWQPSGALDPRRLEALWGLTERIAASSLVPDTLKTEGTRNNKRDLPIETVKANVFFVVEQADRWNMSPFALMGCAAIVHGRLGFEGKVIHAVLESRYGIRLRYEYAGEGENMSIVVSGTDPETGETLSIDGDVRSWKTTGDGSPWRPNAYKRMLAYRGSREWSRLHKPAAILGVLSDDEIHEIDMERRAQAARQVGPDIASRLQGAGAGFSTDGIRGALADMRGGEMEILDEETGEIVTVEVKRTQKTEPTGPSNRDASTGDKATAGDSAPQGARQNGSPAGREGQPREGEENRTEAGTVDRNGESSPKNSAAGSSDDRPAADRAASSDATGASSSKPAEGDAARSNEPEGSNKERPGPQAASDGGDNSPSGSADQETRTEQELDALVKNYNTALWSATTSAEAKDARAKFWSTHQATSEPRTKDAIAAVEEIHRRRLQKTITRDEATTELAEIVGGDAELDL